MSLDSLRRFERRIGALPMPSVWVWAVLCAAFLGFGVLIGRATPDTGDQLAARRAPLKLLVGSATAAPATSAGTAASPPASEPESTPESSSGSEPSSSSSSSSSSGEANQSTTDTGSSPASSGTGKQGGGGSKGGGSSSSSSSSSGSGKPAGGSKAGLPAIGHVFVVMLSDEPYANAFGPSSPARYLTGTLERQGKLLLRYYAVAHEGLANAVALLSGQGPTEATAANCPTYAAIAPTGSGADGQLLGQGCVYPSSTPTLMSQLTAKHLTWKAYVEGIEEGSGAPAACAHPQLGAADPSATQTAGQSAPAYQTWRNPFVYFQAIVESPSCAQQDVGIDRLQADLQSESSTPSFSYIAPGPCDDGDPTPCAPGRSSGMAAAEGFLRRVVPQILASKAYKRDGLLAITVDQAPSSGEFADSSACCGQPQFPNMPPPTGLARLSPKGGGQVGLLLLSPFIKQGGLVQESANHFSLLATIEQIFGLSKLGYAGAAQVKPLSATLF